GPRITREIRDDSEGQWGNSRPVQPIRTPVSRQRIRRPSSRTDNRWRDRCGRFFAQHVDGAGNGFAHTRIISRGESPSIRQMADGSVTNGCFLMEQLTTPSLAPGSPSTSERGALTGPHTWPYR